MTELTDTVVVARGHRKRTFHQPHEDSTDEEPRPACRTSLQRGGWRQVDRRNAGLGLHQCQRPGCWGDTRLAGKTGDLS